MRWLPIGTHDWNMFLKPQELIEICKKNSLALDELIGVTYNVMTREWNISSDDSVNYIAKFIKI